MGAGLKYVIGSVAVIAVLVFMLSYEPKEDVREVEVERNKLMMYCAAGIKKPVAEAAAMYRKEYGVDVEIQYAGSGTLQSSIKVSNRGDLYLAGRFHIQSYTFLLFCIFHGCFLWLRIGIFAMISTNLVRRFYFILCPFDF